MKLARFTAGDASARTGEVALSEGVVYEIDPETKRRGATHPVASVQWLAPCEPTKIVAVGVNYRAHAAEFGKPVPEEPLLFLKPPSALCAHKGTIVLPAMSQLVHHEAELAAVIARRCRHVDIAGARAAILGFTCLNDVTARDLQRKDVQFTRGKGFDTFAPVGPWIETDLDPRDRAIRCRVNGVLRQEGRTSDMVWDVFTLVSFVSRVMTLEPGDIVTTGTPPGVGPLIDGDHVEVEIEGIGTLANRCVAAGA
jgi:2-keto-4-pentenoate hydratase/2-oxohepta-3-ene-1,7-dioic acid hydratase in catechol pathway